jgi:polysaccharide pyruvyl transferase WcaK-like protein
LDYPGYIFDLIDSDKKGRYSFVFFPNASREGSGGNHNNDLILIRKLQTLFRDRNIIGKNPPHVFWVDFDINTEWIRNITQEADGLITSRFHAMISGLALQIPTIVIGWGHKYAETMAYFDMENHCVDFQEIECDLMTLVKKVLSEKENISEKYNRFLPEVLEKARKQFDYLGRELS